VKKKKFVMVATTRSGSLAIRQSQKELGNHVGPLVQPNPKQTNHVRTVDPVIHPQPDPVIMDNPVEPLVQPRPVQHNLPSRQPEPADPERFAAMAAQIEALTQRNAELLQRVSEQSHREETRGGRREEEEELASRAITHDQSEGGHQEDNFREEENQITDSKISGARNRDEELDRRMAEFDKKLAIMEAEKKGKAKDVFMDRVLQGTGSPFSPRVEAYQLPEKFKAPSMMSYNGIGDPYEHVEDFRSHVCLLGIPDEVACRAFPLTLSGSARKWFRKLPPGSIDRFEDLGRVFLTQFMTSRTRKKPPSYLLTLKQRSGETLKQFITRLNLEKTEVEEPSDDLVYSAIYHGLLTSEPVMKKMARKPPSNLQEMMNKVEEFINEADILEAIDSTRHPREEESKKKEDKRKETQKAVAEPKPLKKKFQDYNFTPLNAKISEVLMEVKRDPEFVRPPRIPGNPPERNKDRYCDFHEARGHYTEGCIALRQLIEKLIKNGKLVQFIGGQRNQPRNDWDNRPNNNRDNRNREHRPRDRPRLVGGGRENHPREDSPRGRNQERRERSRSRQHGSPVNQVVLGEIRTIAGGFSGGGESNRARKAYARQARNHEVYAVERPMKVQKTESVVIGFSDEDYEGISLPHTDALVVTLTVANHNMHRILVDNGSSADIMYMPAFKQLNIGQEKVGVARSPLVGFTGEQVQPVGTIDLPVTAGTVPYQATIMVRFLLIDRPSAYNAIIGRAALNGFRAITSTPHLKMKFPTDRGVGEVKGDQWAARQCYNVTLKDVPGKATLETGCSSIDK
jgi:hypothetical protein